MWIFFRGNCNKIPVNVIFTIKSLFNKIPFEASVNNTVFLRLTLMFWYSQKIPVFTIKSPPVFAIKSSSCPCNTSNISSVFYSIVTSIRTIDNIFTLYATTVFIFILFFCTEILPCKRGNTYTVLHFIFCYIKVKIRVSWSTFLSKVLMYNMMHSYTVK